MDTKNSLYYDSALGKYSIWLKWSHEQLLQKKTEILLSEHQFILKAYSSHLVLTWENLNLTLQIWRQIASTIPILIDLES